MAKHIFKGSGIPNFTPKQVGHHYIDLDNEIAYISVGTSSSADWKAEASNIVSINGFTGSTITLNAEDIPNDPSGNITATDVQSAIDELDSEKQAISEKGNANGYASLDSSGKVPVSQLPDTVVGAVDYKGAWNANTNSPDLVASSPDKGDYYVVSVSGSTSLGGITDWKVGDWAIYNGSAWEKVDNTDQVTSVFGRQGVVVAQPGDYTATQVSSTAPSGFAGTTVQANVNELASTLLAHASRHLPSGADPLTTAAPARNLTATTTNSTGSANSLARSDHSHAITTAAASGLSTSSVNAAGTSASLARADHAHAVSIVNSQVSATGNTSTTSGSDVLMGSMTSTPTAGTYAVFFSATLQSNSSGSNVYVSIYSGGSQVSSSQRQCQPRVDASGGLGGNNALTINMVISCQAIVTVNGSQAIETRWRRDSGTATALQRSMILIKLGN